MESRNLFALPLCPAVLHTAKDPMDGKLQACLHSHPRSKAAKHPSFPTSTGERQKGEQRPN